MYNHCKYTVLELERLDFFFSLFVLKDKLPMLTSNFKFVMVSF